MDTLLFGILLLVIPAIPAYRIASGWERCGQGVRFGVYIATVAFLGYALAEFLIECGLLRGDGRIASYKTAGSGAAYNAIFSPVTYLAARLLERRKHRAPQS